MSDEEEEWVVCFEGLCNHGGAVRHDSTSSSSSLRSLLVDLHKSLVDDFRQFQVVGLRHAWQQRREKVLNKSNVLCDNKVCLISEVLASYFALYI